MTRKDNILKRNKKRLETVRQDLSNAIGTVGITGYGLNNGLIPLLSNLMGWSTATGLNGGGP